MKEEHKVELLKETGLFSALPDEEFRKVLEKIKVKSFRRGDVILREEDTNDFMYIVLDGEVKVSRSTGEGKEITLAMHRSGDFFGELALIDGKTVPATVSAAGDSVMAVISKKVFYSLIFSHHKIAERLLNILCSRLRDSFRLIEMLNFNNASQRIKMLLVMLSDKYGKKGDMGVLISSKLTHQDIAEMTGIARETATRVIDKFRKEGSIKILKGKAILLSPEFLQMSQNKIGGA